MPSEMPSKHGVQRAELYTMEKQAETLSVLLSSRVQREIAISPRDFRRNFR